MYWTISKIIQTFVSRSVLATAAALFAITSLANPADVRVLVDVSGSMKQADPNAVRGPATALLAAMLPDQSKGGIWLFGSDVRPLVPYGLVDARWDALASPIEASIGSTDKFTNMESALRTGIQAGRGIHPNACHVILITDGIVDVKEGRNASKVSRDNILNNVLPDAINKACRIHTIALSSKADLPLLRQMAIQTNGLFTLLERPGDLIPVMLDALDLALRSQQLPIRSQSIRVDPDVRQIRLIKLSNDKPIQLKSSQIVITKDSNIEGLDYYSGNGYQTLIWSNPTPNNYELIQPFTSSDRILIDSDVRLSTAELPPTISSDQTLGLTADLTGLKGPIENMSRQFTVSFGQSIDDPIRFKGTRLNMQIDSPPVGRSILTIKSFDNRYERQIQRAFEVLKTRPALEIANNSSQGIVDVVPDINRAIQLSEIGNPNRIESAISSISEGIKDLASKLLGDKSSIASENRSSQDSSKKAPGVLTNNPDAGFKASQNGDVKPNYAEDAENWPLWQLLASALGAFAVVALLIGLILRPKKNNLEE